MNALPDLYGELANWFHLLTTPEDYAEEAEFYRKTIIEGCEFHPRTLLEMGSGGGNNAVHLKKHFEMTLTDLSPEMLKISRAINPECQHIQGDMRDFRLGRQFDAVFVHDAVSYLTSEEDLKKAMQTAWIHCRPGGAVLLCPDCTAETFSPQTRHGGHDAENRGLRYLEWVSDPDPNDGKYIMDMSYLMKNGNEVVCRYDRHELGLFPDAVWLDLLNKAGFSGRMIEHVWDEGESLIGSRMFLGRRPSNTQ